MTRKIVVKLTANFERNLEDVDQFLSKAGATQGFDALLDELAETVIPNLERFPELGRSFLETRTRSVESVNGIDVLRSKLDRLGKGGELHEYIFSDYLVLYLNRDDTVYLLSVKHHRQLSFDLPSIWPEM